MKIGLGFKAFFTNPIFLALITSWLGAQFLKGAIRLFSGKVSSFKELLEIMFWQTGGMPSSHSAVCTSVCTVIGIRNGAGSDLFCFSMAFLFITIRDAFGLRRSNGVQAQKINEIGTELKDKSIISDFKKVKENRGHSPMEIIFGMLFGFLIGLAFTLL